MAYQQQQNAEAVRWYRRAVALPGQQVAALNTRFRVEQQQARIHALTQQQREARLRAQRLMWGAVGLALALAVLRAVAPPAGAAGRVGSRPAAGQRHQRPPDGHYRPRPARAARYISAARADFEELVDQPDAAEQRALAGALTERARAVSALVDNMLDWSRAQTGQVAAYPQAVRPDVLLRSLHALFQPVAAAKGVRLDVRPAAPDVIQTDPHLLLTILRNLLANALKFTPPGGCVTLAAEPAEAAGVRFTVADTGVGMATDKLAAALVTAPGSSLVSTDGTAGEAGTGLGLAVCAQFAAVLGARWEDESAPEHGTRWILTVPPLPGL